MIPPLPYAKTIAVALMAILVVLCALFFSLWRGEVRSFDSYRAEIVAAGKAQEAEFIRVTEEQKQITEDTTNAWKAALEFTRSQHANRLRKQPAKQQMPGISQSATGTDGAGQDAIPASGSLETSCAETTLTLNFLQGWIERQKKASQ